MTIQDLRETAAIGKQTDAKIATPSRRASNRCALAAFVTALSWPSRLEASLAGSDAIQYRALPLS